MLCNVILLACSLLTVSSNSLNSLSTRFSTKKPDILLEGPFLEKSLNPPTHISEFTDPDTGLNPFLDLEEGPTFLGRNVMKDENREHLDEKDRPPFMDFEMVEGESTDRKWILDMDFSKKPPLEESVPMWIPFEEDDAVDRIRSEDSISTPASATIVATELPALVTTEKEQIPSTTTELEHELFFDYDDGEDFEQNISEPFEISTIPTMAIVYVLISVGIFTLILVITGFSCYWRRRLSRTSRSPARSENGNLKC